MNIQEILKMLGQGFNPAVQFTESVRSVLDPVHLDPYMRGRLRSMAPCDEEQGIYFFKVDLSPFEAHNWSVAKEWIEPEEGVYTIFTSGDYPESGVMSFRSSIDLDTGDVCIFELVPERSLELFWKYEDSGFEAGYIAWLEAEVANLRSVIMRALSGEARVSLKKLLAALALKETAPTAKGHTLVRRGADQIVALIDQQGESLCFNGELCAILNTTENTVVLQALGADRPFMLSLDEAMVAIL